MKQTLRIGLLALVPVIVVMVAMAAAFGRPAGAAQTKPSGREADRAARGRYLVDTLGCHDCHTPKKPGPELELDTSRLLSGHPEGSVLPAPPAAKGPWIASATSDFTAWSGPWGVSYAFNLTPDQNTGLGIWTEQMFVSAIRTGRHMGVSRPILPPMPWQMYRNLTDDDLKAVYAYLRTVKPIHNRVPDPVPPAASH
jgi:mono/diheme cytochrome c family protein